MTWGEAWRLTGLLAADPSSYVGAALSGWEQPVSHIDLRLRDLYDLTHLVAAVGSKRKPKPYPRPWDQKGRMGSVSLTSEQLDRVLAKHRAAHTQAAPGRVV